MIDSLLGLVMLMLLTGWMAGVVSIQAMLSSPAHSLTPREQVDVLAAVNASSPATEGGLAPDQCKGLLASARSDDSVRLLQQLLLAPQLMVRGNGQRVNTFMDEQADAGELPYADATDFGKLISFDDRVSEDWQIELSRPDGDGKSRKERLFLCS